MVGDWSNSDQLGPSDRRFLAWPSQVRAIGLAADARKLILAAVGLLFLSAGWSAIGWLFGSDAWAQIGGRSTGPADFWGHDYNQAVELSSLPARIVVAPFVALFGRGMSGSYWTQSFLMGCWALLVWGLFGGAIARIALLQLCSGGAGVGVSTALRFASRRMIALFGAPMTPFLAVGFLSAGCASVGLLYRIPRFGPVVAEVLGFIPLFAGLVMGMILVGLALGWPLMHATVAAEGEDLADALSRSYSYINQRFIRYLAHVGSAWVLGIVGLMIAIYFARIVINLSNWGVSLGAPADAYPNINFGPIDSIWASLAGWLVQAYAYSYFWSAASIVYLILRRDVDGTAWSDVYTEDRDADLFADEPAPTIEQVAAAAATGHSPIVGDIEKPVE